VKRALRRRSDVRRLGDRAVPRPTSTGPESKNANRKLITRRIGWTGRALPRRAKQSRDSESGTSGPVRRRRSSGEFGCRCCVAELRSWRRRTGRRDLNRRIAYGSRLVRLRMVISMAVTTRLEVCRFVYAPLDIPSSWDGFIACRCDAPLLTIMPTRLPRSDCTRRRFDSRFAGGRPGVSGGASNTRILPYHAGWCGRLRVDPKRGHSPAHHVCRLRKFSAVGRFDRSITAGKGRRP